MKLSRVRVAFQVGLHAVLIGHVVAYYWLDWRSVGALDFQSFFRHFLGEGLITVGALLAILVYLSAAVFGRLFCSWGCHFGATQDFAAWVLRRCGWRPPLVRTRFLHWSPVVFLAVIFGAPLVRRWAVADWSPRWDLAAIGPWDTLPGVALSVATFAVCGAAVLLFLGTRGFCRFVCPYGAVFRATDWLAPFRVRKVSECGGDARGCSPDATPPCTMACPTAIDVHRETTARGEVTSVDCVRCNLCIEACPQSALAYSARRQPAETPVDLPRATPTLPLWGEVVVAAVAAVTYVAVDLVYGGHFLAAVLALGEGWLAFVVLAGIAGREDTRVFGRELRRTSAAGKRRWTGSGVVAAGAFLLSTVPIFEAGAFKTLRWLALRDDPAGASALRPSAEAPSDPATRRRLERAANRYARALEYFPGHSETRRLLLGVYVRLHDRRAVGLAEALDRDASGTDPGAREILRWVYRHFGESEKAAALPNPASGGRGDVLPDPPSGIDSPPK